MFCKNCGTQTNTDAKFCAGCGTGTENSSAPITNSSDGNVIGTIKCGNCGYVGMGEKARSTWAQVLAWLVVIFAPLITIIYFLATFKWRCPKCRSSFLGIKKEDGVYHAQRGGAGRIALIIICVLMGIAIIGILSSVVLVSLNSASQKGQDASIKATLSSQRASAELYWDANSTNGKNGSYVGFCKSGSAQNAFISMAKVQENEPICNDSTTEYVISALLNSGKYYCVDSSGNDGIEISEILTNQTSCNPQSRIDSNLNEDQLCSTQFPNTKFVGNNSCDCKSGYEWNTEQTGCYQ